MPANGLSVPVNDWSHVPSRALSTRSGAGWVPVRQSLGYRFGGHRLACPTGSGTSVVARAVPGTAQHPAQVNNLLSVDVFVRRTKDYLSLSTEADGELAVIKLLHRPDRVKEK